VIKALGALASAISALLILILAIAMQWIGAGMLFAIGMALVARLLGVL
jgi:hypothetical protein